MHKTLAGTRILGFSLAGEESVVAAPEYDVCFDVGRAPREIISIDNVCLTHGHMDHAAGIAYYLSQRTFLGNAPGRIIVHRSLAQPIQRLMDVWGDIEGHPSPGQIYGVEPLEDVTLRRDLLIRPFDVNHGPAALGFTLIEARHKLKSEYHGKSGPQLVALKRDGVQIEDRVERSVLTYTGDTAIGRFLNLDFVKNTEALLLDCTFYDPEHRSRAQAGRHIHVEDLPQVLGAVPSAKIMLIHTTRRTDLRVAMRTVAKIISSADRDRVSFLMERPPRPSGGRRSSPDAPNEPGADTRTRA